MSATARNLQRGADIRAALLAVVHRCAVERRPLPDHHLMGEVIGCSTWAVTRQMNRLMNEGHFSPVQRGKRLFVGEVRG